MEFELEFELQFDDDGASELRSSIGLAIRLLLSPLAIAVSTRMHHNRVLFT